MTKTKTVQSLAQELSRAFTRGQRNDGQEFIHLKDGSPQWMADVIHAIHGDKLPDDTVYQFIEECADAIADASGDIHDALLEIKPDPYTSNLTAWLHARVDHVYYLTEVLEEFGDITDGFKLLTAAQQLQIQEIGGLLVSQLEKLAGETESE